MSMLSLRALGTLLVLHTACGLGHALAQPDSDGLEHGWREYGAWVAVSLNSAKAEVGELGHVSFGGFYILGLRYGRVLAAGREIALEYVLDLVPAAVVTEI